MWEREGVLGLNSTNKQGGKWRRKKCISNDKGIGVLETKCVEYESKFNIAGKMRH